MLKILFIRHAQSRGNVEGRMEGWQSSHLTAVGEQQASRLGQFLATSSWLPTHVYSSPLRRATETLQWMLAGLQGHEALQALSLAAAGQGEAEMGSGVATVGVPLATASRAVAQLVPQPLIYYRDELKEFRHGIFDGMTWAEARDHYPELCHQLETNLDWLPIPQAETLQEGQHRAQQFIDQLLANHHNGDRIWVVSHHWILQHMIARLLGCDRTWGMAIANTAIFEFHLDRSRWNRTDENRYNSDLWRLKRFNDCEHLQGLL